jgi:hypothetical protein
MIALMHEQKRLGVAERGADLERPQLGLDRDRRSCHSLRSSENQRRAEDEHRRAEAATAETIAGYK